MKSAKEKEERADDQGAKRQTHDKVADPVAFCEKSDYTQDGKE